MNTMRSIYLSKINIQKPSTKRDVYENRRKQYYAHEVQMVILNLEMKKKKRKYTISITNADAKNIHSCVYLKKIEWCLFRSNIESHVSVK